MIIYLIISFLDGLILTFSINNFKFNKYIFFGGLIGISNFLNFEFFRPINNEISIFIRVASWILFLFISSKRVYTKNKNDEILFRILVLIIFKIFFERIIFFNTYSQNFKSIYLTIFAWIPLICSSYILKNETHTEQIKKIKPNLLRILCTSLATFFFIYSYYFILKNF